jgi:hypothetical protein
MGLEKAFPFRSNSAISRASGEIRLVFDTESLKLEREAFYHPAFYFLVFASGNALLAYGSFDFLEKTLVGLGLVIFIFHAIRSKGVTPDFGNDLIGKKVFPGKIWVFLVLIGCLAMGARFYHLQSLPEWPMWDDAHCSFYSIRQMENWKPQLSYSCEKLPPLFFWLEALFFKVCQPSLESLWLFTAILSVVTFGLGAWAAFKWFSNRIACFYIAVLGLSFWPVYLGRFSTHSVLMVVWEYASLGLLGCFFKAIRGRKYKVAAICLGICTGTGFYIWIVALVPVFLVIFLAFWASYNNTLRRMEGFYYFLVPVILFAIPVAPQIAENLLMGHAHHYLGKTLLSYLNPGQLRCSLSNITVLLWGPLLNDYFSFGPLWGGFLNPILGSFFLLGIIELFKTKNRKLQFGAGIIFYFCLAPGFFSTSLELMRIADILPFCLGFVSLGINSVYQSIHGKYSYLFLAFALIGSVSLDTYHLLGPYHQWAIPGEHSQDSKSPERFRAFDLLSKKERSDGPGLIFSDFYYDVFDQSLYVATYSFNAATNPSLDPSQSKWVAILLNSDDHEILERQFRNVSFFDLSQGLNRSGSQMELAILDVNETNKKLIPKWIRTQKEIQDLFPLIPYRVSVTSFEEVTGPLWDMYEKVQEDPFLKACLLEKIVDFEARGKLGTRIKEELFSHTPRGPVRSTTFKGKFALVFHNYGIELTREKNYEKARQSFLKAASFDPAYPIQRSLDLVLKSMDGNH